jgi:hypothetical protein
MNNSQPLFVAHSRRSPNFLVFCLVVLVGCTRPRIAPSVRLGPAEVEIWIRNVNVIDADRGVVVRDQAIGIAGGTIRDVVSSDQVPVGTPAQVIDAAGAYAIPGLWDSHVHLLQGDEATAERQAARALSFGVTHVRDMGSSLDVRATFLARLGTPGVAAPSMIGAGPTFWAFSLPYGDKRQQEVVADSAAIEAAVGRVATAGVDFIKVYAGFDRTRLPWLVAAARRHGLSVVGHAQLGMTLAEQATLGVRWPNAPAIPVATSIG